MTKLITAEEAMAKAKKNSLARKARVAKALKFKALDKISEMIEEGVVSCEVFLTEEEHMWGSVIVAKELEEAGYKVSFTEAKDEDTNPDMEISIEHLK